MNTNESVYVKTTVWIPRRLHEEAKITAVLAHTTFSVLVRRGLADKIKQLKQDVANKDKQ